RLEHEVLALPAGHLHRGGRQRSDDVAHPGASGGRPLAAEASCERGGVQAVPHVDRLSLPADAPDGGPPPPEEIAVLDVIVDQAVVVDQLEGGGKGDCLVALVRRPALAQPCALVAEQRQRGAPAYSSRVSLLRR